MVTVHRTIHFGNAVSQADFAPWTDVHLQETLVAKLGRLTVRYGGRESHLGTASWFTFHESPGRESRNVSRAGYEATPEFLLWLHEHECDLRIDGSVNELKQKCFPETAKTDWSGATLIGS